MPSVLLVTQDLQRAGAQRQCVELALGLRTRGDWRVEIAVLEGEGGLEEELREAGIPVHRVPRRWRWDLSPGAGLARLSRGGSFEVIHSFMFLPNFYVRLSRLGHRTPLIVCSHRATRMMGWARGVLEILLSPFCDLMIANSEAGREELIRLGMSPARIAVVLNGIDLDRFQRGPDGIPRPARVGMLARMDPDKDHATLLRAFSQVRERHTGARLILAGEGLLADKLRELAALLRLDSCVEMPGVVACPEELYRSLDVYVQASGSSNIEGTSNSLLEAMASGLPAVATRVGGNPEVVRHGETGLLVPPEDSAAMAEAISTLLGDPVLARRLGDAGAERVRRLYSRSSMVDATLDAYASRLPRLRPSAKRSLESGLRGEG